MHADKIHFEIDMPEWMQRRKDNRFTIKSIKAIDVPWHSRKNIWLCFNSRALQVINHDDDVFQLGSTDPETLASFLEK